MARLTPKLVQSCRKVTKTRNDYGDIEYGATTVLSCLYRDISSLQIGNANREEVDVDGMFWFEPDSGVARGDIILFEGEYFRIEKIIKARARLSDNTVHFLKCEVMRQRQVS